jgi:hypothetical protein
LIATLQPQGLFRAASRAGASLSGTQPQAAATAAMRHESLPR